MTRVARPPVCLPRRRLLLAGLALAAADGIAAPFRDPLLTPPMATAIAASSPLKGGAFRRRHQ